MEWWLWCIVAGVVGVIRQALDHARLQSAMGIRPESVTEWLMMVAGFVWRFTLWGIGGFMLWFAFRLVW